MPLSRRSRGTSTINIWPGFVDALTQLTMVIVFVLMVFTIGQFYLSGAVSNRDAAIKQLTQQLNDLTDMLGLERKSNADLKQSVATLGAQAGQANAAKNALSAQLADANTKADAAAASAQGKDDTIATLNQNIDALRQQLSELTAALDLAKSQNTDQAAQITDLGNKLNVALATKVEELARFRSEFFGRLRQILGDRPDIRIVGDRFVFQSEVLFEPASADLSDGARQQLQPLVKAIQEIQAKIPPDVNWLLEVDGHTDKRPINTPQFQSNWELSTARAVQVVKFLIDQGVPAERLAAAGFGEWQPIDKGTTDDAYRHNRRIELKLDSALTGAAAFAWMPCALMIAPIRPGKRPSTSAQRELLCISTPRRSDRIRPASLSTLKCWDRDDFGIVRSLMWAKAVQVCARPAPAISTKIATRTGSDSACRIASSGTSSIDGWVSGLMKMK